MQIAKLFTATTSLVFYFTGLGADFTQAVELADGTVSFDRSPLLIDGITTFRGVRMWGAKYYFTLFLPENAGEPLKKVTISQRQGAETILFRTSDTLAFRGKPRKKGEKLTVAEVIHNRETETVAVSFETPIPPGTTFTIGLIPRRNPDFGGIYLFGVTAFPAGEKPYGLYLGAVRLSFDEPGGDRH